MRIRCLYCGKFIDLKDAETHPYHCEKYKEDLGKYDTTIPPIPDVKDNCSCENCIGIKTCSNCKEETMYLYRPKRIWICAKCKCFAQVRNFKHVITENTKESKTN